MVEGGACTREIGFLRHPFLPMAALMITLSKAWSRLPIIGATYRIAELPLGSRDGPQQCNNEIRGTHSGGTLGSINTLMRSVALNCRWAVNC